MRVLLFLTLSLVPFLGAPGWIEGNGASRPDGSNPCHGKAIAFQDPEEGWGLVCPGHSACSLSIPCLLFTKEDPIFSVQWCGCPDDDDDGDRPSWDCGVDLVSAMDGPWRPACSGGCGQGEYCSLATPIGLAKCYCDG